MDFALHIHVDMSLRELASWLRGSPGLELRPLQPRPVLRDTCVDLGSEEIHLRLFESSDYDPEALDEPDGWLYFRYILEGSRAGPPVPAARLRHIAEALAARIRERDGEAVLLADWYEASGG